MSSDPQADAVLRPEQEFLRFLLQRRFMIQRSRSSGRHVYYPRMAEPLTGALDLEWVKASGLGPTPVGKRRLHHRDVIEP